MEAICSSETSADFQRTTRRYIPEDRTPHSRRCDNLKSYIWVANFVRSLFRSTRHRRKDIITTRMLDVRWVNWIEVAWTRCWCWTPIAGNDTAASKMLCNYIVLRKDLRNLSLNNEDLRNLSLNNKVKKGRRKWHWPILANFRGRSWCLY
jgi:hypothetical protein